MSDLVDSPKANRGMREIHARGVRNSSEKRQLFRAPDGKTFGPKNTRSRLMKPQPPKKETKNPKNTQKTFAKNNNQNKGGPTRPIKQTNHQTNRVHPPTTQTARPDVDASAPEELEAFCGGFWDPFQRFGAIFLFWALLKHLLGIIFHVSFANPRRC